MMPSRRFFFYVLSCLIVNENISIIPWYFLLSLSKDGQTPAELASEAGYDYIASYIINFSFDPEGRKLPGACAEADE